MSAVVHFADQLSQMLSNPGLRWTACGWSADDGSKLVIVTDRALVTCRGCKRTIAYKRGQHESPAPVDRRTDVSGTERIAAERQRQVEALGWTARHDGGHTRGELARAGAVYALRAVNAGGVNPYDPMRYWPQDWHFSPDSESSFDPVRMLVKAGALIAAEIDRLERADRAEPIVGQP